MRALFIGLGSIGQRHLRNLQLLYPSVECAAVRSGQQKNFILDENNNPRFDISIAAQYKIKEYSNLKDGLRDFLPDLVFITNPSSLHFAAAKEALEYGAYIFIEKPFVTSLIEAEELIKLESQLTCKRIMVGFQFRVHPAIEWAASIVNRGSLGNIVSCKFINGEFMPNWHPYEDYRESYAAKRELGGGALLTQIHDFDCVVNLFGVPNNVLCIGGKPNLEIDVEDSVQILMESKISNKTFPTTISLDYLRYPPKREFEIIGDRGTLQCNLNTSICMHSDIKNKKTFNADFSKTSRNDIFIKEMESFINFATNQKPPIVDLNIAIQSLKLCIAAKKSMEKRELVTL